MKPYSERLQALDEGCCFVKYTNDLQSDRPDCFGSQTLILFVIRRWVDIDHLVPIVGAYCRAGTGKACVVSVAPLLDLTKDRRLITLGNRFDIEIVAFHEFYSGSPLKKLFSWILAKGAFSHPAQDSNVNFQPDTLRQKLSRIIERPWVSMCARLDKSSGRIYNCQWWEALLKRKGISCVAMTWQRTDVPIFGELVKACTRSGIKSVVLPRSIDLIDFNRLPLRMAAMNDFDHVVVADQTAFNRALHFGNQREKLKNLGCPRFSDAWHKIYSKDYQTRTLEKLLPKKKKPRIGFFHSVITRDFSPVKALAATGEFEVIYQDKLVAQGRKNYAGGNPLCDMPNLHYINDVPANEIVAACDIIICGNSSIMLDAFLMDKPVIYTAFQVRESGDKDTIDALFDDLKNAFWMVDDIDQLVDAARSIVRQPPEEQMNASRAFLQKKLPASGVNGTVLEDYVSFLHSLTGEAGVSI